MGRRLDHGGGRKSCGSSGGGGSWGGGLIMEVVERVVVALRSSEGKVLLSKLGAGRSDLDCLLFLSLLLLPSLL